MADELDVAVEETDATVDVESRRFRELRDGGREMIGVEILPILFSVSSKFYKMKFNTQ